LNPDSLKQTEQNEARPPVKRSDELPQKKLDPSYTVNLSESAQAKVNEPLPPVRSPEDARRQLDLIKAASMKSPASLTSAQNPGTKSAIDLLT
jgi:hypothetical protein